MGRRQRSHQPQTHVPPDGTPAPAPRVSPPMPGGWRPAVGRGDRAALEGTDQEDSAQNSWKNLPQCSSSQWAQSGVALFDHLMRPLQERRRDGQAEGPGGLEVDDELE